MVAPSPYSRRRIRIFRSPVLEGLTVMSATSFAVLWAVLLPVIAAVGLMTAPTYWAPLVILAGLIFWTAVEYVLHRYLFHFETESRSMQRLVFIIHGNHHDDPNDPLRNLMPPIISVPVGALIWAASLWVFGPVGTWFLLGFMIGYVGYDLVHYACHQLPMKGRFARMLKTHHMRHHHLPVNGNFAITGMVWDRIFATRITSTGKRS